jgi:hypothetical protein
MLDTPFSLRLPAHLALLAMSAALLPATPALAQEEQAIGVDCREVRSLDALQYWFWDGYSGLVDVHDFTHERWGRLGLEPSICFRIALVLVDDPQQKSAGYRQAVNELIQWVVDDGDADDDNAKLAATQLKRLTGEDFDTPADWSTWWEESRDFVMWSEDKERLVVVTEALASGEVVHDNALLLDAEEYWFDAARGWMSATAPVGEYVFGSVLIPPHDFNFRAYSDQLDDRGAKERGYRRALENLFVDGLLLSDLAGKGLETVIGQISSLTEESFVDRGSWVAWWNRSRDRLTLSADGTRLVVRN